MITKREFILRFAQYVHYTCTWFVSIILNSCAGLNYYLAIQMLKFPQSFLTVHLPCQISWNSEKPFFGRATYSEIESKISHTLGFLEIFPRLRILKQNFMPLLYVVINAKLQHFIQLPLHFDKVMPR